MMAERSFLGVSFARLRGAVVVWLIALTVLASARDQEIIGDNLQVALPIIALGCEVANGSGVEYLGRYVVMFVGLRTAKVALGDQPINIRPHGGGQGFPSGHTATAAFGAGSLVSTCLKSNPLAQMAAILAAGFTGASRIEARAHDIWQVLAGAIWGLLCNYAFRREGPGRRAIGAGLRAARRGSGRAARRVAAWLWAGAGALWRRLSGG